MKNEGLISPPHNHSGSSIFGMMFMVCVALLPGVFFYVLYFGWGVIIQCILSVLFAIAVEWLMLKLRKRPVSLFLKDGSAMVTGLLFALSISPFAPWWVTFTGIFFAIAFAKHIYGGLGQNPFNPAMAGYVFILLCFPSFLNTWPVAEGEGFTSPSFTEYSTIIFQGMEQLDTNFDAISGASPLNHMKSGLNQMAMVSELTTSSIYGFMAGRGWEMVNIGFLVGGILLLITGVTYVRLPLFTLGSFFLISTLFYIVDAETYASPIFHCFSGATMLAVFFIATDPVTAPSTFRGRMIYGSMIGFIAYIIRVWGGYPDGFAFAVLLANAATPVISYYTIPTILGGEEPPEKSILKTLLGCCYPSCSLSAYAFILSNRFT
jgi:electron transport complex protein RnfD